MTEFYAERAIRDYGIDDHYIGDNVVVIAVDENRTVFLTKKNWEENIREKILDKLSHSMLFHDASRLSAYRLWAKGKGVTFPDAPPDWFHEHRDEAIAGIKFLQDKGSLPKSWDLASILLPPSGMRRLLLWPFEGAWHWILWEDRPIKERSFNGPSPVPAAKAAWRTLSFNQILLSTWCFPLAPRTLKALEKIAPVVLVNVTDLELQPRGTLIQQAQILDAKP